MVEESKGAPSPSLLVHRPSANSIHRASRTRRQRPGGWSVLPEGRGIAGHPEDLMDLLAGLAHLLDPDPVLAGITLGSTGEAAGQAMPVDIDIAELEGQPVGVKPLRGVALEVPDVVAEPIDVLEQLGPL